MMEQKAQTFTASLSENLEMLKKLFGNTMDYLPRTFQIGETPAALITIDGLVNKQTIAQSILQPILSVPILQLGGQQKLCYIRDHALATVEQKEITQLQQGTDLLMAGFALLLLEGASFALAFGVQGFPLRSVDEPANETMQLGSREGFVESVQVNVAMIRRRLRTPDLRFESMTVGKQSRTQIALCYLTDRADPAMLEKLKQRLENLPLDNVLAVGYLAPFIHGKGVFNGVGMTERPDTVCGKIEEGRIAILINGTPNVLLVPYLFIENFQSFDDYAIRPSFAVLARVLKFLSFFISMLAPGIFVSVCTFHPELLPMNLLTKVAQAITQTPLSMMAEMLLVQILYEILREAGLRVPRNLSQIISIVGALVIGETAINAGFIGGPTLLVVAVSAVCSYTIPSLYEVVAILRILFILLGGTLGLWGICAAVVILMVDVCGESLYGIPLTAPLSPFSLRGMRDFLWRTGWKKMAGKPYLVKNMPGAQHEEDSHGDK
ncbi:MAG: spore germination protein [Clostridia bacterium]|nr:spore germination protein [Clostridia bacterium]